MVKDDKLSSAISIFFYCPKMVSSLKIFLKLPAFKGKGFNYNPIKQQ